MAKSNLLFSLKLISWIGMVVLFIVISVAAIQKRNYTRCDRLVVRFKNNKNLDFLKSSDVIKEIQNANPSWSGQRISKIKLNLLENAIKQNEYVKKAELYIDNENQLNVMIEPKLPIARIHTETGSYYLSETWDKMSLAPNSSRRIIQVLGNVSKVIDPKTKSDSFVIYELKTLFDYFSKNKIWYDFVDQIYIARDNKVSFVFNFCDPMIEFGYVEKGYEKRMKKIDNFFKVIPRYKNLADYEALNFEFSNQVVARRKVKTEDIKQ